MNNDLLLGQLGMSSLLSRRAEHSVVILFKLIHGLVDCSDLFSQVTFKVNRPACRTKNTVFLPTRHSNIGLSSPVVWLTYFVVASMLLRGAISTLSLETCNRMLVAWCGLE
jgi:hypothetical protein